MRRIKAFVIAAILIISCTQMTFAVINKYYINDGKASNDLKALKELYDDGILTEEEYTSKKKQLLGL